MQEDFEIPKQEYEVYDAIFNGFTDSNEIDVDSISVAIIDSTFYISEFPLDENRRKKLESEWNIKLPHDLLEDYRAKNASRYLIQDRFRIDSNYEIISSDEYREIFNSSYSWLKFEEKYPDIKSIIKLSRVGLNTKKDKAILFIGSFCGNLCSSTWFIYFEKKDNIWELAHEQQITVG